MKGESFPQEGTLRNVSSMLRREPYLLRLNLSLLRGGRGSQQVLLGERFPQENRSSGRLGETSPKEDLLSIGLKMLHHPAETRRGGWDER